MIRTKRPRGFALPTVLIASVVMLMVLVTAVSTTAAVRSALQNQYYNGLADDAADAGTAFAEACLKTNGNTVTWSDSKPLKPNTDCDGTVQSGLSAYIRSGTDYRTYFVVYAPTLDSNRQPTSVSGQGYVEALRKSSGTAWRVFSGDTVSALTTPGDGTPVGTSLNGYWTAAPQGYLLENGQAVSRTTYSALFSVIGTTYGAGDGSTTFNVPNSTGRVEVAKSTNTLFDVLGETGGATTHTLTIAEMPSHRHQMATGPVDDLNFSSYTANATQDPPGDANGTKWLGVYTQYEGGGDAHNIVQPYITVLRVIKY